MIDVGVNLMDAEQVGLDVSGEEAIEGGDAVGGLR